MKTYPMGPDWDRQFEIELCSFANSGSVGLMSWMAVNLTGSLAESAHSKLQKYRSPLR